MGKVLITDAVHPLLIEEFEKIGLECDYEPNITLGEVKGRIHEYMGLIINSKIIVDRAFIDKAIQLKFIGRLGSGMEMVDQVYATQKGIPVFRSPEGNCNAVAEHALGMLLALLIHLRRSDREVRKKVWNREKNRGIELMGKTVGIIGFGYTGRQFAQKLLGMGVKVLAYDKYKTNYAVDMPPVKEVTMQEIFEETDILSLHVPLAPDTHHLLNTTFIEAFKKPIILINTSRGKAVNTTDLITALRNKRLIGACLDVFENEKPKTFNKIENETYNTLCTFENVLLTPHVAGWTKESKKRMAEVLLHKILKILPYSYSTQQGKLLKE